MYLLEIRGLAVDAVVLVLGWVELEGILYHTSPE